MRPVRFAAAGALAAVLLTGASARALPVQTASVDLLTQAQVRLDGPSGSQAGAAIALLPGGGMHGREAVAVGMPGAGPAGRAGAGAVAVVLGAPTLPRVVDLSGLDGRDGFVVFGAQAGDHTGFALAAVSRPHGPALLAIGAPQAAALGRAGAGVVYLIDPREVHGPTLDLARPGRALVALIAGPAPNAQSGYALAGGSLSREGGDLLLGAPSAAGPNGSYAGAVFAVFGTQRPAMIDLARRGPADAAVLGSSPDAGLGSALAIAPGGSGPTSVWMGAPTASPDGRAAAGSVFGVSGLRPGVTLDSASAGAIAARLDGAQAGDGLGGAVAVTGQLPGRGVLLALGAPGASPAGRRAAGEVILLPPRQLNGTVDLSHTALAVATLAGSHPFDGAGFTLAAALDPARDEPALAVGAPFVDGTDVENLGAGYVLGGRPGTLPADLGAVGSAGLTVTGARADDQAASALASGWALGPRRAPDLLVGAPYALTASGEVGGAVYLLAGVPGATPRSRPSCSSRRTFVIRLAPALRSARVVVNGRRVLVRRRGVRLTARVDLRSTHASIIRVRVIGRERNGRVIRRRRVYHPCVSRRRSGPRPR